jgi:hypothetical protein
MKNVGLGHPQVVTQKWLHSVREMTKVGWIPLHLA